MKALTWLLPDAEASEALGALLAQSAVWPKLVFMRGVLGAGKTTLVRGFLRASGYRGVVTSPTYSFVESYVMPRGMVYHFDLYRFRESSEIESIGYRDYLSEEDSCCFVEWPERALSQLGTPDLVISLEFVKEQRVARISAKTDTGQKIFCNLGGNESDT